MAIYDCDMRQALLCSLSTVPEFDNDDTYFVNELEICGGVSRADIAVINGKLHGYEIKSQQDNLERLPSQVASYNQVFDTMTLVTCKKHLASVRRLIPKWWGIYYISGTNDALKLKIARQPKQNKVVDKAQLAQLLWKDELIRLLCENTSHCKGLKSKSRHSLSLLVAQSIPYEQINEFVRETLKNRQDWRAVRLAQLCDGSYCTQPT